VVVDLSKTIKIIQNSGVKFNVPGVSWTVENMPEICTFYTVFMVINTRSLKRVFR
jgi:hypothetical protein